MQQLAKISVDQVKDFIGYYAKSIISNLTYKIVCIKFEEVILEWCSSRGNLHSISIPLTKFVNCFHILSQKYLILED